MAHAAEATPGTAVKKRHRFRPSEAAKRRARVAQAYVNLGLSQLALGSGGILARFAMDGMSLFAVGAFRLGLVGVILLARAIVLGMPPLKRRDEFILMGAGLLLAQQFLTWMLSIAYLSIGTATLLYCTAPLWNGLYEVFFLKRKLPHKF